MPDSITPARRHGAQQLEHRLVTHPFLDCCHQPVMRNRRKTVWRHPFSTTHRRPRPVSSTRTCRGVVLAPFSGRNPKLHGAKSASKIGSSTILSAACTMRFAHRRNREAVAVRSFPAWGYIPAAPGSGPIRPIPQFPPDSSPSSRSMPYSRSIQSRGGPVDTRCAVVGRAPRPSRATGRLCVRLCPTAHEIVARVRPLAVRLQRVLQGTHLIQRTPCQRQGLRRRAGTSRKRPLTGHLHLHQHASTK